MTTSIPTEPIGSIPRPETLLRGIEAFQQGAIGPEEMESLYEAAVRDTLSRFEETESPVITDGEQRKYHNFATYTVDGSPNFSPDGFKIHFSRGHFRQWPRLLRGPFRYRTRGDAFLKSAKKHTRLPVKQAVISPSALSLFYPEEDLPGYGRDQFLQDAFGEYEAEVRSCLAGGAHCVQTDFTEGRLSLKLDPTGKLLESFIHLNNLALSKFSDEERRRIGIHTCPGGDRDSTHSADVDYADFLPGLFELKAGIFYVALAREKNRSRVLEMIRDSMRPGQRVYIGVIDVLDPRLESEEEVRDLVLEAARYIPLEQLGTTDDCGFAPFSDDRSTSRELAFAKIKARVRGTARASEQLNR